MELLLDTHMAIWYADGSPKMPARAVEIIGDPRNEIYVSDLSAWEVAIKHAKRPDALTCSAAEFIRRCDAIGFQRLRLDRGAIIAYENLDMSLAESMHKDPFDRMLLAQAKDANMLLATHDENIRLYNEPNVMIF